MPWVVFGEWVIPGQWVEPAIEEVPEAPAPAITLPSVSNPQGATNYGDPGGIALIHHRNPGPYSDEPIFFLKTWSGLRLFGKKMPPDVVTADDIGRFATLLSVQSLSFNTVPLGNDLVGSISATERPTGTVTLDNSDGSWSQRVMIEPLLGMPAAHWQHYGGGDSHLILQGQVERVVIRQRSVSVTYGEP